MSKVHLRKYGEAATFNFDLFEIDGVDFKIDAVHASGDTKIMKDEGVEANTTNGFTDEGQGYSIIITATEMEHARGRVYIVDQSTKAWLDTGIIIETYGHASAQHPYMNEGIWDRSLTGATHNIPTSAGRRLRSVGDVVSFSVNDATPTALTFITDLVSSVDGFYNDTVVRGTSGVNEGATRIVESYDGTTKEMTFDEAWPVIPSDGDDFDVRAEHIHPVSQIVQEIWDRVLTEGNHNIQNSSGKILRELKEIAGYEGGFIYIDTIGGAAGDEAFINGTLENPVNNITDANTLAATLSMCCFHVAAGSSITFAVSQDKQVFTGEIWTLALGGQSVSASTFHGANVSGICTGTIKPKFEDCNIAEVTLPPCHMDKCGWEGPVTAGSAGDFFIADNCHSAVAGTGAPIFDFGAAIGDVRLNLRWYSGGIDLRNMGQTGTDRASIEGNGQVIINANCIGGTIAIRGHQTITGRAAFLTAGGTISDGARFAVDQIPHILNNTIIDTLASQTSFTLLDGSADDNAYNNALVVVTDTATAAQKAVGLVFNYVGSTKTITLASDPAIFTMAAGDCVAIIGNTNSAVLSNTIISEKVDTLLDINKPHKLTVDTTTRLEYQWLDSDGDPVDITDMVFKFKAVENTGDSPAAIAEVTGSIQDAVNGRWYFDILPTTIFKGKYEIWSVDGGTITTLTRAGGAKIEVVARL